MRRHNISTNGKSRIILTVSCNNEIKNNFSCFSLGYATFL